MATRHIHAVSELPSNPAVYALYGGTERGRYVAYVGVADKLKYRIAQHLVRRDSSVATGTSAVTLNADQVTEVRWWEHPYFVERGRLEAAEIVAFNLFNPVLRSRGAVTRQAKELMSNDAFVSSMTAVFSGEPAGIFTIPTLTDALERIAQLERRLAAIEARLSEEP